MAGEDDAPKPEPATLPPNPDSTYDASDPAAVEVARRHAGRRRKADADVLRHVMRTVPGRAWVWRLLEGCHVYETSFVQGQGDATAFREGERNVGLRLLAEVMKSCPDLYMVAMKERNQNG